LHSAEIARLLEAIPPKERVVLWSNIDTGTQGDILKVRNCNIYYFG
jgi:magnesium transporter